MWAKTSSVLNDENARPNVCPASARDDFKLDLNLARHFSGLVCDARRPSGATYSRTEAAALLVAYNRLNQVRACTMFFSHT
jgi:hypothetical protein